MLQCTPYARKWASRNEPEGSREPSHNLRAMPISLLLCSFQIYGTGHHSTAAILYRCYCLCHEFRLPCPRILLQSVVLVRLPRTFSNFGHSLLEPCFTCFTIPVQSHKCLKWVQLMAISPDSTPARTTVLALSAAISESMSFLGTLSSVEKASRNPQV